MVAAAGGPESASEATIMIADRMSATAVCNRQNVDLAIAVPSFMPQLLSLSALCPARDAV